MSSIKILSLNVRGLRNQVKRRALFAYLKNQKADFYCLQETFSQKLNENTWCQEWGGKIIFSHGTEHSKGTCILQKPNSACLLKSLSINPNGRYVFGKISIADEELFIASVYAPNDHQLQLSFSQALSQTVVSVTNTSKLIITGDWNTTLHSIDKRGGAPWKETGYRNSIICLLEELGELHPNKRASTYESKALKLKSRIDFFLISHSFISNAEKAEVRSSIAPDHKALFLRLQIDNSMKRGPGTWKFNNLLLGDNDYRLLINAFLPIILEKYKDVESKKTAMGINKNGNSF